MVAGLCRKFAELIFVNGVRESYLGIKAIQDAHSPYFEKFR